MIEFVVVDNRKVELDALGSQLSAIFPTGTITLFMDPLMSAKYVCNNPVDIVLIADVMRPVDGFTLMKVLRTHKPDLPIVMLSDSQTCHQGTKQLAADYYFIKPLTSLQIRQLGKFFIKSVV